ASIKAERDGFVPVFGAYVGQIAPGSPGERAGLMSGDVITELNMRPINKAADLQKAMAVLSSGSNVSVAFTRGNNSLRAEVKV
ncbi:PDZ domain-containing protein, partial [Chloroflexota bacterium]